MIHLSVSGLAGSGKDTLADILCELYGYKKDHFAFDLKFLAEAHFNWDRQKDDRGRDLLQQLGTDVGRDYCRNIWLIKFCKRHGLKVPGDDKLPNDGQSLAERITLGLFWKNHGKDFPACGAANCCDKGQCCRSPLSWLRCLLSYFSPGQRQARRAANSLAKARLLAMAEFGWNGHADQDADRLVANIEKLARRYDAKYWERTPLDFDGFLQTVVKKCEEESASGERAEKLIVPDCRFPNELDALVMNGFFSVQVQRPGVKKMGHASETSLDGRTFHVVVKNDGTLDDLKRKAAELMRLVESGELATVVAAGKSITL